MGGIMATADSFASGNLVEIAVGVGDVREPLFLALELGTEGNAAALHGLEPQMACLSLAAHLLRRGGGAWSLAGRHFAEQLTKLDGCALPFSLGQRRSGVSQSSQAFFGQSHP